MHFIPGKLKGKKEAIPLCRHSLMDTVVREIGYHNRFLFHGEKLLQNDSNLIEMDPDNGYYGSILQRILRLNIATDITAQYCNGYYGSILQRILRLNIATDITAQYCNGYYGSILQRILRLNIATDITAQYCRYM